MIQRILFLSLIVFIALPIRVGFAAGNYQEVRGRAYLIDGMLRFSEALRKERLAREENEKKRLEDEAKSKNGEKAEPNRKSTETAATYGSQLLKCDNQELLNNFDHALAQLRYAKASKTPDENPTPIKGKFSDFLKRAIGEEAFKLLSPMEIAMIDKKWSEPIEFQQAEIMLTYGRYMNQAYAKECNHSSGKPKVGPSWYAQKTSYYIATQSQFLKPNAESSAQAVSEVGH